MQRTLLHFAPTLYSNEEEDGTEEYKDPDEELDHWNDQPSVLSLNLQFNPAETYGRHGNDLISRITNANLQSSHPLARRTWRLFCGYRILFCNGFIDYFNFSYQLLRFYFQRRIRSIENHCHIVIPPNLNDIGRTLGLNIGELREFTRLLFSRGKKRLQLNVPFRSYFSDSESSLSSLTKMLLLSLVELKETHHERNVIAKINKKIFDHMIEMKTLSLLTESEKSFHSHLFVGYNKHRPIDLSVFGSKHAVQDDFSLREILPQLSCIAFVEVSRHAVPEGHVHKDFVKAMEAAAATMAARCKFLSESGRATAEELRNLRQYVFLIGARSTSVYVVGVDISDLSQPPDIYSVQLSYSIDFPLFKPRCDIDSCLYDTLEAILKWNHLCNLIVADGEYLLDLLSAVRSDVESAPFDTSNGTSPHQSASNTTTPATRTKRTRTLQSAPAGQPAAKRQAPSPSKGKKHYGDNLIHNTCKQLGITNVREMYLDKIKSSVISIMMGKLRGNPVVIKVKNYGSFVPRVRSFEMEAKLKELMALRRIVTVYMQELEQDEDELNYQICVENYLVPLSRAFSIMAHGFSLTHRNIACSKEAAAIVLCTDVWSALAAMHERGILHCDIKDVNIMYDTINDRYVLMDLDHSRHVPFVTQLPLSIRLKKHWFGTRGWYAPELGISDENDDEYLFDDNNDPVCVPESETCNISSDNQEWCLYTSASEVFSMALVLYHQLEPHVNTKLEETVSPILNSLWQDIMSILSMEDPLSRPSAADLLQSSLKVGSSFGLFDQVRQLAHNRL